MGFRAVVEQASGLDELYPLLASNRFTAGWHKASRSLWEAPRTEYRPLHWRYQDAALALDRAGEWIGTDLAERRNLVTFNPIEANDYASVRSLVAAYQMIKPGEDADAHRHTPAALRVVLHAEEEVYTVVDGVELPMATGDVLLTPGFTWHSHYNAGSSNAYWVDVLNVPMVQLLEPMFYEEHPDDKQPVLSREAEHPFRIPIDVRADVQTSVNDGHLVESLDVDQALPAMTLRRHRLSANASIVQRPTTASRIFVAQVGHGSFTCGDGNWSWARGDVFVVPSWHAYVIEAHAGSVLLEVSDERALRKLGLFIDGDPTVAGTG
ncbi:cupin domain-containing protein [Rhodococcus opacus]|uniref:cupin domain-containing protein n=1 Tax=Rhodococcus opacus TaxID=37919 RepID=UPI00155A8031|nr:cupin domain-containing protein [Rhodococcus opacus]